MKSNSRINTLESLEPHFTRLCELFSETNDDSLVSRYLTNVAVVNESTARKYKERLKKFGKYTFDRFGLEIQNIVTQVKKAKIAPYDLLTGYILFLKQESKG